MKRFTLILVLAAACSTGKLSAQVYETGFFQLSKTEQQFEPANSQWLRHKFYIALGKGNYISIQLANKTQLAILMNLDSVLNDIYSKILLVKDSLKDELTNKKIDFSYGIDGKLKMRFQEFKSKGSSYGFQQNELVALKIEQDTVNILGYYRNIRAVRTGRQGIYFYEPYRVQLLLNNITELKDYLNKGLNQYLVQIKTEWDQYKKWTPNKNWGMRLTGTYGFDDPKRNAKLHSVTLAQKAFIFDPFVQLSLQNVRNLLGSALGLGIDMSRYDRYFKEKHFQLFWEPFFFFEKNPAGKTILMRNDFISFQYKDIHELKPVKEKVPIRYYQQFSLSYLFHKDGNYFEKNTFRVGLPGFQTRNVSLTPEFIFHDFFKQFTPSLKLALYLE